MNRPSFPPPYTPRAVLFDLDGTLADTAPDLAGALNDMRVARGMAVLSLDELRPHASSGARGLLKAGLGLTPEQPDYEAHRLDFLATYERRLDCESRLFDGMVDLLNALQARGLLIGIVTNKIMRFTEPVVAALGLTHRVAVVIGGDSTPHAKPHPEPLFEACRRIDLLPSQAIYLGDDLRDIQSAQAAGMPSVAVEWGYLGEGGDIAGWGADAVIQQPRDLLGLLAA